MSSSTSLSAMNDTARQRQEWYNNGTTKADNTATNNQSWGMAGGVVTPAVDESLTGGRGSHLNHHHRPATPTAPTMISSDRDTDRDYDDDASSIDSEDSDFLDDDMEEEDDSGSSSDDLSFEELRLEDGPVARASIQQQQHLLSHIQSSSTLLNFNSTADDEISVGSGGGDTDAMSTTDRSGSSPSSPKVPIWYRTARGCLYLGLLVLAIVFPFSVYRYLDRPPPRPASTDTVDSSETHDSHSAESIDAAAVPFVLEQAWEQAIQQTLLALDGLAVDVSTTATAYEWPFVTVPDFSIVASHAMQVAPMVRAVSWNPLVTDVERLDYEAYVMDSNAEWIPQALEWQQQEQEQQKSEEQEAARRLAMKQEKQRQLRYRQLQSSTVDYFDSQNGTFPQIFGYRNGAPVPTVLGLSRLTPIRQIHPLNAEAINYLLNEQDLFEPIVSLALDQQEAQLGDFSTSLQSESILRALFSMDAAESVFSTVVYPVFDSLKQQEGRRSVGVIAAIIDWRAAFVDAMPPSEQPITISLVCQCPTKDSSTVRMILDGPDVRISGTSGSIDPEVDSMGTKVTLQEIPLERLTTLRVPLNQQQGDGCEYTMYVADIEESRDSRTVALICFGVMGSIILLVCIYDGIQQRRTYVVMKEANEARAIVASLFPAMVRDRLFETNREKDEKKRKLKAEKQKLKKQQRRGRRKEIQRRKKETEKNGMDSPDLSPIDDKGSESQSNRSGVEAPRRDRDMKKLMLDGGSRHMDEGINNKTSGVSHPKHRLKNYLTTPTSLVSEQSDEFGLNKPIADLYPNTTVMFADIVGFTAWSSEREPEQVFTLLQQIYHSFDRLARRREVFKVETIGDCYMCVTGLPMEQPDHALRMAKFARECMTKMTEVTKKLEVSLGPDTGDLCMRLGLNSGPVTAGVLQGEKSRFQLFGDTVNTASRMESTGDRNKIQCSKSTADLIKDAGKSYWVKPRAELVHAKGKGKVQTFWIVTPRTQQGGRGITSTFSGDGDEAFSRMAPPRTQSALTSGESARRMMRTAAKMMEKPPDSMAQDSMHDKREERLIQWQVEIFVRLLKKIVAAREEMNANPVIDEDTTRTDDGELRNQPQSSHTLASFASSDLLTTNRDRFAISDPREIAMAERIEASFSVPTRQASVQSFAISDCSFSTIDPNSDVTKTVVDEVAEAIALPKFASVRNKALDRAESVVLSDAVMTQLKDYIITICQMYRSNPFHNFEHASHVTLSANKFLNRVVTPENVDYDKEHDAIASQLHDYTFGITSDPLTQFAIVFSALVHDCDHTGVPNAQLAKENPEMSDFYHGQSLAEQNSVDLAWDLYMDPRYKDLQTCIAANDAERSRFRQLVVNMVMATDIFDPTMKDLRNTRWNKAFHNDVDVPKIVSLEGDRNLKATIVIEHIIQAADVAHTMQHWHIYQKWNERLFEEMYSAFECGRSSTNPAEGWYKGEIWFFDNYVIPLAKKLAECGVFGVSSDECLNYAQANRNEWEVKGKDAVQQMVSRYNQRKFFVAGVAKKRKPNRREAQKRGSG